MTRRTVTRRLAFFREDDCLTVFATAGGFVHPLAHVMRGHHGFVVITGPIIQGALTFPEALRLVRRARRRLACTS